MLGLRQARKISFAFLLGCIFSSTQIVGLKVVSISEPLIIRAQKNSPPYIAFEELLESEKINETKFKKSKSGTMTLLAGVSAFANPFGKAIQLAEMVVNKQSVQFNRSEPSETKLNEDNNWIASLPASQMRRIQEASQRGLDVHENWQGNSWEHEAIKEIENSGVLNSNPSNKIFVAAQDANGKLKTDIPKSTIQYTNSGSEVGFVANEKNEGTVIKQISGPIEITGGLAVTNEHHIEIRRTDEGVLKELGSVDIKSGLYKIAVQDIIGTIVARLVDVDGRILGEASFRLSQINLSDSKLVQGPKLRIQPRPSVSGFVSSFYNAGPNELAPPKTSATLLKGQSEISIKRDGLVAVDNIANGSTSILRTAAPGHFQTASLVVSGVEFKSKLYPTPMINALIEIVGQQRGGTFSDTTSIIWGVARYDGKPVAGIDVLVESDLDLQPIYFNQFLLPDPNLKSTSENGIFAFIDAKPGFHSLLARKSEAIFGYQNVVVESGSVAEGDIFATAKKETVPVRVFDAFSGDSIQSKIEIQSLDSELEFNGDFMNVLMPFINRTGMMRVQPVSNDFIAAKYTYNDQDDYIHAPVIRWSWISSIRNYLRIDDMPDTGTLVGFVPNEDFEIYLAGEEGLNPRNIVYFDMQGKILSQKSGIAGGGFIIFNAPEDTHEIISIGKRSGKIFSQVVPVDPNSLSIVTFKE